MKILITGGGGMLARALADELPGRGHEVIAFDRGMVDVTDARATMRAVVDVGPQIVIHCAAYTDVDGAEAREEYAREVNAVATSTVARACERVRARLVYPSTDYVFDGSSRRPYDPADDTRPINAYGRSKLLGEKAAAEASDRLIVRTSWLYGDGGGNFVRTMIQKGGAIARGEAMGPLRVVADQRGAPTWTHSLARTLGELLARRAPTGVYHATDAGDTTWYDLAQEALRLAGLAAVPVEPVTSEEIPRPAARPRYSVLDLCLVEAVVGPRPHWRDSLAEAIATRRF
ncbi:MAG TPA: dTDP-4-dehydrorhamnose reductase [Longimicrobiales bacterium]|nr:dTDP-4-dehydrorhamnose reductase [Longimicrobiales bacterium]